MLQFKHGDVKVQIVLADPFEPPHKVAELSPKTLSGVDMHLVYSVPVVVPGPFTGAVADGRMVHYLGAHPVVGTALVAVTGALPSPVQVERFLDLHLRGVAEEL